MLGTKAEYFLLWTKACCDISVLLVGILILTAYNTFIYLKQNTYRNKLEKKKKNE